MFEEGAEKLYDWMVADGRTDMELAFWLYYYIKLRGRKRFATLGPMSTALRDAAKSQDDIGWRQLMEGKLSKKIVDLQVAHCQISDTRMTGRDWAKHFIGRILAITHSQWIYRNYILHERTRGYLRLQERKQVLLEIERLADLDPAELPESSRFLLEVDFDTLLLDNHEKQSYWVRAVRAAIRGGRRAATRMRRSARLARLRHRLTRQAKPRQMRAVTDAVLAQLHEDLGLQPVSTRRRRHPSAVEAGRKSNKQLCKLD